MLRTAISASLLAAEAQRVIGLRFVRLAWGGSQARVEARLMVLEKIDAAAEAIETAMLGGSPHQIITRYREYVAGNLMRLTQD